MPLLRSSLKIVFGGFFLFVGVFVVFSCWGFIAAELGTGKKKKNTTFITIYDRFHIVTLI